ncbi:MAG: hypothetical protein EBZ69_09530, partial [Alphaproteobacteria bacterium]|nr:hypothetical protein [Alphaproteobacteria bacterium]
HHKHHGLLMTIATKNGAIIVKDGKLAENCGCCGCKCGDTRYGYSQQGLFTAGIAGRWCCSGVRPQEITLSLTASAIGGPWVSYQTVSGAFSLEFYDNTRGYYLKRYKRTLTLNIEDVNLDYVLSANIFNVPGYTGKLCGYATGLFAFPRVFPGVGAPGAESQSYPSYTITYQTGNSNLPEGPPTRGTLRREYEYKPLTYLGFYQFAPAGDWTRDASLDTESAAIPCTYSWSSAGEAVFHEQACDLRTKNLSWSNVITVNRVVLLPNYNQEVVEFTSPLPQFNMTAAIS